MFVNKFKNIDEYQLSDINGGDALKATITGVCIVSPATCLVGGLFAWGFYNGYEEARRGDK